MENNSCELLYVLTEGINTKQHDIHSEKHVIHGYVHNPVAGWMSACLLTRSL